MMDYKLLIWDTTGKVITQLKDMFIYQVLMKLQS